jgi:hypothetical protein
MIRRYLADMLCIGLVGIVALLAAQRPVIDLSLRSPAGAKKTTEAKKEETPKRQEGVVREVAVLKALKERNIFAANGSYVLSKSGTQGPLPENPYTLIGILKGEEKKAVFRDYNGSIITLTVGRKLMDGTVVTRIDDRSVQVVKGKEKKELRIFNVKVPPLSTGKKL